MASGFHNVRVLADKYDLRMLAMASPSHWYRIILSETDQMEIQFGKDGRILSAFTASDGGCVWTMDPHAKNKTELVLGVIDRYAPPEG